MVSNWHDLFSDFSFKHFISTSEISHHGLKSAKLLFKSIWQGNPLQSNEATDRWVQCSCWRGKESIWSCQEDTRGSVQENFGGAWDSTVPQTAEDAQENGDNHVKDAESVCNVGDRGGWTEEVHWRSDNVHDGYEENKIVTDLYVLDHLRLQKWCSIM